MSIFFFCIFPYTVLRWFSNYFLFFQRILQLDPAAVRTPHLPGGRLQRSHPPGEDLHAKHVHHQGKYLHLCRACASLVWHVRRLCVSPVRHVRDLSGMCASILRHVRQLSGMWIILSGMCVNCHACKSHCQACAWQAFVSTVKHVNHNVRHVPGGHVR